MKEMQISQNAPDDGIDIPDFSSNPALQHTPSKSLLNFDDLEADSRKNNSQGSGRYNGEI